MGDTKAQDRLFPIAAQAFAYYTVPNLIVFGTNAIEKATGSRPLAGIKAITPVMRVLLDDLLAKNTAAMNRGREEIMQRKAAKAAFVAPLRDWANYARIACAGSVMTLVSFGFEARRAPSPKSMPGTPANFRVGRTDKSGEAMLRCRGGRNVRNFSVQYGQNVDGPGPGGPH